MTALTITLCAVLAFFAVLGSASVRENGYVKVKKGDSLTMECSTRDFTFDSLELHARNPNKYVLMVYDNITDTITIGKEYSGRVTSSGTFNKRTVTINNLQLNESGLYKGIYSRYDIELQSVKEDEGCAVLLFVTDVDKTSPPEKPTKKGSPASSDLLIVVITLTACNMVMVFFLVMWVLAFKVLSVTRAVEAPIGNYL